MDIHCHTCKAHFVFKDKESAAEVQFCPSCGKRLSQDKTELSITDELPTLGSSATLIEGHIPEEAVQFSIGPYQVIRNIGKGGMGEVFLAYDTTCGRRIALKRIREDLVSHTQMHYRFLKEARVTSQLTHPAIIPIYAIHENDQIYYTMPFVEGETLKQIFRESAKRAKKSEKPHQIGGSIPSLMRIFLTICQAVAYAHSHGVLHRDLKSENIIIGKYGEVMILDWGLAKLMRIPEQENNSENPIKSSKMTNLGKVVGTISYMAPERALGNPATVLTDIYSLGVILYQILTLRMPFKRGTLKEFRQRMDKEELYDPIEVAPYREVPKLLSTVVLKCLSVDANERYQNVDELVKDIENYLEGRSEWYPIAELRIENKSDWEFQENVLIAEHVAITRGTDITDWVNLMISSSSFPDNIKIDTRIRIGEKGQGIGFLLSIPEAAERNNLNDGYCLWLGSDTSKSTKLLRSTVEVLHAPEVTLQRHEWYHLQIVKLENNIHLYLNETLQFSYIIHTPLTGTHIGLLARDADFVMDPLIIYSGNQSIKISCLAVPDAFLAHKDFNTALIEYRRIGYAFPGTSEGREALFRAGITLLEQGSQQKTAEEVNIYYERALEEFNKLHSTPGAPLEYLGKALVYQELNDPEEEIKCFELAYRRYPGHPLLPILNEELISRMYETSRTNRITAYNFALLALRFLPNIVTNTNARKLFSSLKKNWEPLYFLEEDHEIPDHEYLRVHSFNVVLSFWLAKPYIIAETIDTLSKESKLGKLRGTVTLLNALFCLIELGTKQFALEKIQYLEKTLSPPNLKEIQHDLDIMKAAIELPLEDALTLFFKSAPEKLSKRDMRILFYILVHLLFEKKVDTVIQVYERLETYEVPSDSVVRLDSVAIAAYLMKKDLKKAEDLFHNYPLELLNQETTYLHFLYGTWLYLYESKEIAKIHYAGVLDVSFPRTWTLGTHFLYGKISETSPWSKKAFMWEKRQLFRQLAFFYSVTDNPEKAAHYAELKDKEYVTE